MSEDSPEEIWERFEGGDTITAKEIQILRDNGFFEENLPRSRSKKRDCPDCGTKMRYICPRCGEETL